jgi:hypothetical protein
VSGYRRTGLGKIPPPDYTTSEPAGKISLSLVSQTKVFDTGFPLPENQ